MKNLWEIDVIVKIRAIFGCVACWTIVTCPYPGYRIVDALVKYMQFLCHCPRRWICG